MYIRPPHSPYKTGKKKTLNPPILFILPFPETRTTNKTPNFDFKGNVITYGYLPDYEHWAAAEGSLCEKL